MFTTIRTYRVAVDDIDDVIHKIDIEFAQDLASMEGFVAYEVLQTAMNQVATVTTCRDEATALRTNDMAAQWIARSLAGADIERLGMFSGEVMVSRAAEEMLIPAHH